MPTEDTAGASSSDGQVHLGFSVELAERLLNSGDQVKRLSVVRHSRRSVTTPATSRRPRLNAGTVEELVRRYGAGETIRSLVNDVGVDRSTVQRHLAAHDVPTRYRKLGAEEIEECAHRYRAGESTVEIAADLGVHKVTVRRRLVGIGVRMRSGRFGQRA